MKRFLAAVLALILPLCALSSALAGIAPGANASRLLIEEDQVEFKLKDWEQFTLVTPENMEEHMDLLTMRGETAEQARFRFQYGNILLEAYNTKLFPEGVVRVQRFEDEMTRSCWHLADLPYYQVQALADELSDTLYQGYLRLFHIKLSQNYLDGQCLYGSVIWYPPFEYESGLFGLYILNGKMYLLSYLQRTPASKENFYTSPLTRTNEYGYTIIEMTYSYVKGYLPLMGEENGFRLTGPKQTAVADLRSDPNRLILNVHSGPFTVTGSTEAQAQVTVSNGNESWPASVSADKTYACEITLHPGENQINVTAGKAGLRENTLTQTVQADDEMAALELTEFPYGTEIRNKLRVAGRAAPGAQVTVQIDENDPVSVALEADGQFNFPFTVEENWVDHEIVITAREEGRADCSAKFTFSATYEEAQQGLYAYRQTLTPGLTVQRILADPAACVGCRAGMDVQLTSVDRRDGILSCEGRIDQDPQKNIVLLIPDYMDDEINPGMLITVYGVLDEPTLTEPPLPRMKVEYIYNLIIEYR